MTDKKDKYTGRDEELNTLFNAASCDEWAPLPGFTERVMALLESEASITATIETICLRFIPFTAAASAAVVIISITGESLESLIYSSTLNPFAIEGIVALLGG